MKISIINYINNACRISLITISIVVQTIYLSKVQCSQSIMYVLYIHSIPLLLMYSQLTSVEDLNFNRKQRGKKDLTDLQNGLKDLEVNELQLFNDTL